MTSPATSRGSDPARVVLFGGGPGGYEAALVAAQLGAHVTVVDAEGLGGAAVLTDVVPSKTLIATAEVMTLVDESVELGVRFPAARGHESDPLTAVAADLGVVNSRVKALARAQSADIRRHAAAVLEAVFRRRGLEVLHRSRAQSVKRTEDGVVVQLADGRTVEGSHCLMAVGAVPNTSGLGLAEAGVALSSTGHVQVDRVSRTTARGVYAAGDCTGVLALASVAAMQGRIAMWHALGDAVAPIDLRTVSATVFTAPEIATVGWTSAQVAAGEVRARSVNLPLATNARAKMQGISDGFVKLFCGARSAEVLGGVVVAPRASELIFPVTLAVARKLTVDDVAQAFTVYPSLSGSLAEAARKLHLHQP